MFMIYFLNPFMKYENSENRFSEFSLSWKTFLLNLFSCLINSFIINDVCKNLKENVNIKVKSKHKVVFRTLYWKNWKIDSSSFFRIMDFNFDAVARFQAYWDQRRYEKLSEAATRGVLYKEVFLEILQNSQENTCARVSFLIKLQASGTGVFLWILWNF